MIRPIAVTRSVDNVEIFPGQFGTYIESRLVDPDTNLPLSSDEVREHFANFNIVNVAVLSKPNCPRAFDIGMGYITDIDDTYVYLGDNNPIPRENFLDWYRLD